MKESRPPHTTAMRFCASCAVTLLCWVLWLLLGGALAWQGYMALVKDISVPDFVLRRIEAKLAAENFSVRFGRAHLDSQNGILLENVQLFSRSFEEPLLTGRSIYLRKSIWSILAGQHLPDVVKLEGASVQLPAMLSPSGTAEQLLREVNAEFHFSGEIWSVERLTGRIGNLLVSITGNMARPRGARGTPLGAEEITNRYLQLARQAVLFLPELESIERPHLAVTCTPREDEGGMDLHLTFAATSVRRNEDRGFELGPIFVAGQWRWDGLNNYPVQLQLSSPRLTGARLNATGLRTLLTLEPGAAPASLNRIHGQIAATSVQALGDIFEQPVLTGSYRIDQHLLNLDTAFHVHGHVLSVDGAVDLARKSARTHFIGTLEPAFVTGLLTRYGPKLEPYFRFADPVHINTQVQIDDDWQFGGLTSRVHSGRLDSHGVQITSTRGQINVDAERNFYAYDAFVLAGENEARGSYWMNFRTMGYRFLMNGRLRPPEISGWFHGDWWPVFWSNFSFPNTPPRADVDVQGFWRDARLTTYFGNAIAGQAEVMQADFAHVQTRIFLRPGFTHALDLTAERAAGTQRISGWFIRKADPGPRLASEIVFDLTGNLDSATLEKLGGENAVSLVTPWTFSQPPELHLWGLTTKQDGLAHNDLQFTGQVAGPLAYYHFPLEQLAVNGKINGEVVRLEQIDLQIAGGHGNGQATINGPADKRLLRFDFKLADADLARTIRAIEIFEAARTGVNGGESMTESKFIKRANGGKLEVTLNAQGNPETPDRLNGTGTMRLTGAELAEINLFGLLSQILSAVSLNFSSLRLDTARTSFRMADGQVYFPDIRVSGKSAVIDAKGNYFIDTKLLDFTAHLKPYEEIRNPLTAMVGLVMNPLTSMFQLQLTGPISNPKWAVVLGSASKPLEPELKPLAPDPAGSDLH